MDSPPSHSAPDTVSAKLRMILRGLQAVLGLWLLDGARAIAMYRRIGRTLGQIEWMLTRFRAGKLRVVPRPTATRTQQTRRKPDIVLPRQFGWLVQVGAHHAVGFGSQLQVVLNDPDMVALLAASAQARRVLRPLCRALAVELPWTMDKPRAERKPRVRKPRPKPEPFRIPLPRGALSWARREGFGKLV